MSSTDSEYVVKFEACIRCVAQVLQYLGIGIQKPMMLKGDNMRAMCLIENETIGDQTKIFIIENKWRFGISQLKFV